MTTKNSYELLYREFNDASRLDEKFGAILAYTITGEVYTSGGVDWGPCNSDHSFGAVIINPSSGPVVYQNVRLYQTKLLSDIDPEMKIHYIDLCKQAGSILPQAIKDRYGIPGDTTPELRWLGLVVEVLRNHELGYVKRSENDSPVASDSYCHDTVDRPFLACAKAIEVAGLFSASTTPTIPVTPAEIKKSRALWVAEAMLLVRDHPEWSDRKIAKQVGVSPSTVSRCNEFQVAAAMARGSRYDRPSGYVDPKTGTLDGVTYNEEYEDGE